MIHILIDTCSLLKLVHATEYSSYLLELENYVNNNTVRLYMHKHIQAEWNKHVQKETVRKEKIIAKNLLNNQAESISSTNTLQALVNTSHITSQTEQIEAFLKNSINIPTAKIISDEVVERLRNRLPPFHNKPLSVNDWEILGSVCIYCDNHNIDEIIFLSHNHTDFGESKDKIHPTIQERFKVNIKYFSDFWPFFENLRNAPSAYTFPSHLHESSNSKYSYKGNIKANDLDSIQNLYNNLYKEISFIPINILRKHYPFAVSDDEGAYYNNFTLFKVNDSAIEALESSTNKDDISNILANNLIFYLNGREKYKNFRLDIKKSLTACQCCRCMFNRLDFSKLFEAIQTNTNLHAEFKDKLKVAYINFQVGNVYTSYRQFLEIKNKALEQQLYITYFISLYNLKQIGSFLGHLIYDIDGTENISKELKKIDLFSKAVELKLETDYNLLIYIAEEKFFSEAFQSMSAHLNDIKSHYRTQLKGGWSVNKHIWSLQNSFLKLYYFLNQNFIIYDRYIDFERIFEMLIEGFLCSYAINDTQGDKITSLDDYWVHKFLFHGNPKTILKYVNLYHLNSIKYKTDIDKNESFRSISLSFLTNESDCILSFNSYADKDNKYFSDKYNSIFENIITMSSLLELEIDYINIFAEHLLNFLQKTIIIKNSAYEILSLFFSQKGRFIESKLLDKYLSYFLNTKKGHNDKVIDDILDSYSNNSLLVSNDQLIQILENSLQTCKICSTRHTTETLNTLYKKVESKSKKFIKKYIQNSLKSSFEFEIFDYCTMYGIIPKDKALVLSFINKLNIEDSSKGAPIDSYNNQYRYLDNLLNLCFKLNINTNSASFQKFAKISDYYEWIIDMDNFDYSKFNPEWILHFQTLHYSIRMSKSRNLKRALVKYLRDNTHSGIEKRLIEITYYSKEESNH
ncbi:PIN domain-containing protein [Runella sp.]|uniref:PIN domain-containing protein n=1 Tax=Runella sp. TaxID=1960881 RepID=UPI003D0A0C4B